MTAVSRAALAVFAVLGMLLSGVTPVAAAAPTVLRVSIVDSDGIAVETMSPLATTASGDIAGRITEVSAGIYDVTLDSIPAQGVFLSARHSFAVPAADRRFPLQWYGWTLTTRKTTAIRPVAGQRTDIRFQVIEGATISGRVTGLSMPAQLSFQSSSNFTSSVNTVHTATDGTYFGPLLWPGTYEVTVGAGLRHEPISFGITLEPGLDQVRDLDFVVAPSISGKVTREESPNSSLLNWTTVTLYRADDPAKAVTSARVADDGSYLLPRLEPGDYLVRFGGVEPHWDSGMHIEQWWPNASMADARPVRVNERAETLNIDAHLAAGGKLRGTIHENLPNSSGIGDRIADIDVFAVDGGNYRKVASVTTSPGGDYTTPPLPGGTYTLRYTVQGGEYPPLWLGGHLDARDAESVLVKAREQTSVNQHRTTIRLRYFDIERIAGANRYETAVAVSKVIKPSPKARTTTVYLANGTSFPDALSAGSAAIERNGVVLLTTTHSLPAATVDELARLRPATVKVVGGTSVVSDTVMRRVATLTGARVTRIGGANRWETSAKLSRDAFPNARLGTVFVTTGKTYADALVASNEAGRLNAPVLLVDGTAQRLPSSIRAELRRLQPGAITVIGGRQAVNDRVLAELRTTSGSFPSVYRTAGADRYETAAEMTRGTFAESAHAVIVSGTSFADALAAAPLAAALEARLLPVRSGCFPAPIWDGLADFNEVRTLHIVGGEAVLAGDTNYRTRVRCQ